jgi:hypothetical protein
MAPYYDRQRNKTYGKYSAATLYKFPQAQSTSTRYFTVVKYLESAEVTDNIHNQHAQPDGTIKCLKSAVRAGDLVDCPLFEKMRYQFGGFRLEHTGASWTVSGTNDVGEDFAPIAYSSLLVQDYKDATGMAGGDGSDTAAWLANHDRRVNNHTTQAEFYDRTAIDSNINTKVHVLKSGSTTISPFYKSGKRFDQRGTHSLSAAGTPAEWALNQAQQLRGALDEQCKCSLLFFLPKATVQCAVVSTFKVTFMGQPNVTESA